MEVQDDVSDKKNELESTEDEEKVDDELLVPPGEDENSIDQSLQGTNLLMNSLLVLMVLTIVLLFIAMIVLCKKFVMPRCCGCMKAFCTYIGNKLMFNSVIRGLLESYFPLCIATFYQLSQNNWGDEQALHSGLAIITVIYIVLFPVFSLCFVLRNFKHLQKPIMRNKYGSFYQNVDPTRKVALRFTFYFCLRRVVFAMVICFMTHSLVFQVMVADFAILALLSFYTRIKPMKDELNNTVQIFNEIAIIVLLQFMFMLTDFTEDPVERHDYGYYFLYYVATLIGINICILIASIVIEIRRACRRWIARRKARRDMKKQPTVVEMARILSSIIDSNTSNDEESESE